MRLCDKIIYLRKKRGWSQEQLSIKLGISRQAVYKWEAGISLPEIDKLTKLSKIFEISYNDLLDDDIDIMVASDGGDEPTRAVLPDEPSEGSGEQNEPMECPDEPEASDNDDKTSTPASSDIKEEANQRLISHDKKLTLIIVAIILASLLVVGAIIGTLIYFSQRGHIDDDKSEESSSTQASNGDSGVNTIYYTVQFDSAGGEALPTKTVASGSVVGKMNDPVYDGHVFCGWYTKDYVRWDLEKTEVTTNVTLYAMWIVETGSIILHKNDGSGETISFPYMENMWTSLEACFESSNGSIIIGWSDTPNGEILYPVHESIIVSSKKTPNLYAIWEKDIFVVDKTSDSCVIVSFTGGGKNITIPKKIDGLPVVAIADDAFRGNTSIESIAIPEGVKTIGSKMFYGCTSLYRIYIPSTVNQISTDAFLNCPALTSFHLDSANSEFSLVAGSMLYNKEGTRLIKYPVGCSDTELRIPDGTHYIEDYAFYGCSNLKKVYFPEGVGGIGKSAFEGCYSLQVADLGNRVDYIGARAFFNCHSLEKMTLEHNTIYSIGNYAFAHCYALDELLIYGNIGEIGFRAFYNCIQLTSIISHGTIDKQDENAFEGCTEFTGVEFLPAPTDS